MNPSGIPTNAFGPFGPIVVIPDDGFPFNPDNYVADDFRLPCYVFDENDWSY